MRDFFIDVLGITLELEPTPAGDPQVVSEALFFPEILSFGTDAKKTVDTALSMADRVLEEEDPIELSQRQIPSVDQIEQGEITIRLSPMKPKPAISWREPVYLTFRFIHWQPPTVEKARIAYVPGLGIEVYAPKAESLEVRLEDQIRSALGRERALSSLHELAICQRETKLIVESRRWNAYPISLEERFDRGWGEEKPEAVLPQVARELSKEPEKLGEAFEREAEVERLGKMLAGARPTSVLLVGESGAGKTSIFHQLVRERKSHKLAKRPIFATSGSRLVAGMSGFGEWQQRCGAVAKEAAEKKAVLFFGNLFELLNVGQSSASTESIGSYFRPHLIRGEFLAVVECTPAQLALIEQNDPRILDAFRQVVIDPTDSAKTKAILKKVAEAKGDVEDAAIARIDSLHRRFSGYSAMPGRAISFMSDLIDDRLATKTTDPISTATVDQTFARQSGMPRFLLDESVPLDLTKTREFFSERILGQDIGIDHAVDTVAMIKSQLNRPGKPLSSFLFIGPTGVGKTELAKTMAEYLYGSKDRLMRIDMSEYAAPGSGNRLVAGSRESDEGLLTSTVRDQPFSVLLLDEFEKADSSVFDLFLQVLGEARLTDAAGRLADFSNAIVILTSNLGAAEFRATRPGFFDPDLEIASYAKDHFTEAVKKVVRPEFFNRIDQIVPFMPLSRDVVKAVVSRELELATQRRDGLRSVNVQLVLEESAIDFLAEKGYDPRYGARPVKRAIEQFLLRPLADDLNDNFDRRSGAYLVSGFNADDQPTFEFVWDRDAQTETSAREAELRQSVPLQRRVYQRLMQSQMMADLQGQRTQLRRRAETRALAKAMTKDDFEKLRYLNELSERITEENTSILAAEEQLVLCSMEDRSLEDVLPALEKAPNPEQFRDSLLDVVVITQERAPRLSLIFQAESRELLGRVVKTYADIAGEHGMKIRVGLFKKNPPKELVNARENTVKPIVALTESDSEEFLTKSDADTCAMALEISGPRAALYFEAEAGLHLFLDEEGQKSRVLILSRSGEVALMDETFDIDQILRPDLKTHPVRRQYDAKENGKFRDSVIRETKREWAEFSHDTLRELIGTTTGQTINALL